MDSDKEQYTLPDGQIIDVRSAVQSQKAVTAYFLSRQLLPFCFAFQSGDMSQNFAAVLELILQL